MKAPEPQPESASPPTPLSSRLLHALKWFGLLSALYLLSLGPAVRLWNAFPPARTAIEIIYSPLARLSHVSPTMEKCFKWYTLDVWGVR